MEAPVLTRHDPTLIYDFEQCIGKGSYGKVYKAVLKGDRTNVVAFKVLPLEDGEQSITVDTQRELASLRECQDRRVVRYLNAYFHENRLWIAMEYCLCSMHSILAQRGRPLDERQIAAVCGEALRGLQYLHKDRQIIHRDVKAGNILVTERGQVKLADFGVSAQLSGTLTKRNTVIGTPMWMSPEMIEAGQYDHRTDIWSLGITAIELAQMKPPLWDVTPPVRVLFLIPSNPPPQLQHPEHWSSEFRDFIHLCLTKDPSERPDAPSALALPFISDADPDRHAELLGLAEAYADAEKRVLTASPKSASTLNSTVRCERPVAEAAAAYAAANRAAGRAGSSDNVGVSWGGGVEDGGGTLGAGGRTACFDSERANATLVVGRAGVGTGGTLLAPVPVGDAFGADDFAFMCDYDLDSDSPRRASPVNFGGSAPMQPQGMGTLPSPGAGAGFGVGAGVGVGAGAGGAAVSSRDVVTGGVDSRLPPSPPGTGRWTDQQQATLVNSSADPPLDLELPTHKSATRGVTISGPGSPVRSNVGSPSLSPMKRRSRRNSEGGRVLATDSEGDSFNESSSNSGTTPSHRRNKSHGDMLRNGFDGLVNSFKRLGTPRNSSASNPGRPEGESEGI